MSDNGQQVPLPGCMIGPSEPCDAFQRQTARIAELEAEIARTKNALRQANVVRDTFALALVGLVDKGDNLQGHQVDKTPNSQVPNDDDVICPNCVHQFRAGWLSARHLLLAARRGTPLRPRDRAAAHGRGGADRRLRMTDDEINAILVPELARYWECVDGDLTIMDSERIAFKVGMRCAAHVVDLAWETERDFSYKLGLLAAIDAIEREASDEPPAAGGGG